MARKSSVDKARDEVRDLIHRMLRDNRLTLDQMRDVLEEQFPGEEVPSRTALHRYRKGFDEIMRHHREIQVASDALVAELGENFDDKSGALLAQAVTTLATRASHSALEKEEIDISDVLDLTAGIEQMLIARDRLTLPLENHNYLRAVVYGIASDPAQAQAVTPTKPARAAATTQQILQDTLGRIEADRRLGLIDEEEAERRIAAARGST